MPIYLNGDIVDDHERKAANKLEQKNLLHYLASKLGDGWEAYPSIEGKWAYVGHNDGRKIYLQSNNWFWMTHWRVYGGWPVRQEWDHYSKEWKEVPVTPHTSLLITAPKAINISVRKSFDKVHKEILSRWYPGYYAVYAELQEQADALTRNAVMEHRTIMYLSQELSEPYIQMDGRITGERNGRKVEVEYLGEQDNRITLRLPNNELLTLLWFIDTLPSKSEE